jgi:hypothetical protein
MPATKDGWSEWGRHVLAELERLNLAIDGLDTKLTTVLTDIAVLKIKAGVWGLVGGLIPVTIGLVIMYLQSK